MSHIEKRCFGVMLSSIAMMVSGLVFAEDPALSIAYDGAGQVSQAVSTDPSDRWDAYLKTNQLVEGVNYRNGKPPLLILSGIAQVGKKPTERGFVTSRTNAYAKALLVAKASMAEQTETLLDSTECFRLFAEAGENAPAIEGHREQLSIMDKALTLSGLALDQEIKKYEPDWDGTGRSTEEKLQRIAEEREVYCKSLSQKAYMFLQGAVPIFNAEGFVGADKAYEVVVGVAWTPNMTKVAEAMYNPTVVLKKGKQALPIPQQIENRLRDDPNFLAAALGVRVWWNENGERTVVSFSPVHHKGSVTIAKRKSELLGRTAMARFISSDIVSNGALRGGEETQFYADNTSASFDSEVFEQELTAISKTVSLQGVAPVFTWRGKHPVSKERMYVTVLTWSPSGRDEASMLSEKSEEQKETMESYGTEIEEGTCREFVADIKVGGRTEKGVGISCQQADGSWKIQQQPIFITECPDGTRNNYKGECVAVDGGTATGGLSGPSTDPKDL